MGSGGQEGRRSLWFLLPWWCSSPVEQSACRQQSRLAASAAPLPVCCAFDGLRHYKELLEEGLRILKIKENE